MTSSKLKVTVDTREQKALFKNICMVFPDVDFEHKKLDHGDYWASCSTREGLVLVERKTLADLYQSLMGEKQANGRSRMANEVDKLTTHENEFVIIMLIGSIMEFQKARNALQIPTDISLIYAEIASLMAREHFHIMWSYDEMNARIMMVQFMQAVHAGKYGVPARRDPVKQMARILRITPDQLKQLLTKYKTLHNLSTQPPENLTFVRGIASARASFILEMLNSEWL